jgi:hypothetical protein
MLEAGLVGGVVWAFGEFSVTPCAGAMVDRVEATGFGVARPSTEDAAWVALTQGLVVALHLGGAWSVRADAFAVEPLARPRFELDGVDLVHVAAPVAGRVGVGADVRF